MCVCVCVCVCVYACVRVCVYVYVSVRARARVITCVSSVRTSHCNMGDHCVRGVKTALMVLCPLSWLDLYGYQWTSTVIPV